MGSVLVIEPHYFPSIAFWSVCLQSSAEEVIIDGACFYRKQSYLNRCYVLTAHGVRALSVPIAKPWRVPLCQVAIDYRHSWQQVHLRTLEAAYGKAPYFEYYAPDILPLVGYQYNSLWQLHSALLKAIHKLLGLTVRFTFSEKADELLSTRPVSQVWDMRYRIHPKKKMPFEIEFEPYMQNFGAKFVENLSILDLLFCLGPTAVTYLKKQVRLPSQKANLLTNLL